MEDGGGHGALRHDHVGNVGRDGAIQLTEDRGVHPQPLLAG
jgi:hypothetical protein